MDSPDRLSENGHDGGISRVDAGKFHIVSQLVWGNALQHELSCVGVFALVAFKRNPEKSNPDGKRERKGEYRQNPPGPRRDAAIAFGFLTHGMCNSADSGRREDAEFAQSLFRFGVLGIQAQCFAELSYSFVPAAQLEKGGP